MRRKVFAFCKTCNSKFRRETYIQRICSVCHEIKIIENSKRIYPPSPFKILQQKIFKRDGFTCRICRTTNKLNMHHWDKDRMNNRDNNLVTLCHHCHRSLHALYRKRGIK